MDVRSVDPMSSDDIALLIAALLTGQVKPADSRGTQLGYKWSVYLVRDWYFAADDVIAVHYLRTFGT